MKISRLDGKPILDIPQGRSSKYHFSFKSFLLAEVYKRNQDSIDWLDVFKNIRLRLSQKLSTTEWETYCKNLGIRLEIVKREQSIGGYFDIDECEVVIEFSYDVLLDIETANEKKLQTLAKNFWVNFVHEDTHRQQQMSSKESIYKNYKPTRIKDWNKDLKEDLEYFDQHIEADEYGREIGARLQELYPRETPSSIFSEISENNVKDQYVKNIINVYRDPRMTSQNSQRFFRALYDFLSGDEE